MAIILNFGKINEKIWVDLVENEKINLVFNKYFTMTCYCINTKVS